VDALRAAMTDAQTQASRNADAAKLAETRVQQLQMDAEAHAAAMAKAQAELAKAVAEKAKAEAALSASDADLKKTQAEKAATEAEKAKTGTTVVRWRQKIAPWIAIISFQMHFY
jgi:hypothetical protein